MNEEEQIEEVNSLREYLFNQMKFFYFSRDKEVDISTSLTALSIIFIKGVQSVSENREHVKERINFAVDSVLDCPNLI